MNQFTNRSVLGLVALLAMLAAGCGGSNLGSVTGTVTLDGEPLPDALVMFNPIAGGRPSAARTDASGKYELVYDRENMGAEPGEHLVEITTEDEVVNEDDTVTNVAEKVPTKYNAESDLRETVELGAQTIDFALDSQGEIISSVEEEATSIE